MTTSKKSSIGVLLPPLKRPRICPGSFLFSVVLTSLSLYKEEIEVPCELSSRAIAHSYPEYPEPVPPAAPCIMSIDFQSRMDLQKALVGYMAGRICTSAFDDQNTACQQSSDKSVQEISRFLYSLHDDLIDHPISVTPICWEALLRVVAFLGTGLEIRTPNKDASWPFPDSEEWHANENSLKNLDLPEYDISIHYRIANPWWNRIPSRIGLVVLGCIIAGVAATLFFL